MEIINPNNQETWCHTSFKKELKTQFNIDAIWSYIRFDNKLKLVGMYIVSPDQLLAGLSLDGNKYKLYLYDYNDIREYYDKAKFSTYSLLVPNFKTAIKVLKKKEKQLCLHLLKQKSSEKS